MATETAPTPAPAQPEVLSVAQSASPRGAPQSAQRPARRRVPGGASLLALAAYAAYAVLQTWPLATNPTGLLAGASVGPDRGGATSRMAYLLAHHLSPFLPATLHGINAPEGLHQAWVLNWVALPSNALLWGFDLAFGAIAGENAFVWLSFVGSAMAMFWLCRRLFGYAPSAFLAGFAFAFFPFAVQQIDGHEVYASGWVLVLVVWRMLELIDRPNRRNALWAGTATACAMWFTPYFLLFGGMTFAALCIVALVVGRGRGEGRRMLGLCTLATVPILALFSGLAVFVEHNGGASADGLQVHGINELNAFSAHPLEWFLPDRRNPIVGSLDHHFLSHEILSRGSNFAEASLYVGVSVIALAIAGLVFARRQGRSRGRAVLGDIRVVAVAAGVLLALASAILALPPMLRLGHFTVATPYIVIWTFTTTWRGTARMVEVTELGLCLAMAAGATYVLAGRARRVQVVAFSLLLVVIGLDLWARPPQRAVSTSRPPEYAWLAGHPGGIVADYPLWIAAAPKYSSLFWASSDGHPSFQGYAGGPVAAMKYTLRNPSAPHADARLAALGVRYVVIHPGLRGGSPDQMRRHHFVLRFRGPSGSVYELPRN